MRRVKPGTAAIAVALLAAAWAAAPSAAAGKLTHGQAERAARAAAREAERARPRAVRSGTGECRRVAAARFRCEAFVIEDRAGGLFRCAWPESVARRDGGVESARRGRVRCARENLAPGAPGGWFPFAAGAQLLSFTASEGAVRIRARGLTLNAHASVAFHRAARPGHRYSCAADVDVARKPASGPAAWFVWVGSAGASEWMGAQAIAGGRSRLVVGDVAPPGAEGLLCVFGNGGPSRDGRQNAMGPLDELDLAVDPGSAVLWDGGAAAQ